MPRKPKREKRTIMVDVKDQLVRVILHPPTGTRKCWYAYWPGQKYSVSTGQRDINEAIREAKRLVEGGTQPALVQDTVMSDEEFLAIQKAHFKVNENFVVGRDAKTWDGCKDAIEAFQAVSKLSRISQATPDDCARFQREALKLPKNWRRNPTPDQEAATISEGTVFKWSRELQAAFERANRNAGKKCVRGVVDSSKLLNENPWTQFTWTVSKVKRPIRQFDGGELLSLLDYLATNWQAVTVPALLAKVYLWSWARREEAASLTWSQLREVGNEYHFESVGKRGVVKWFRVPEALYHELLAIKTDSPFVFAAYNEQIRQFYLSKGERRLAMNVGREFGPAGLSQWLYRRIAEWSESLPKGRAYTHIFRKTSMQYARSGEDINRLVAHDASVSPSVMMTHYVEETDEEMRQKSNRTYQRIVASLSPEVAQRYGYCEPGKNPLEEKLKAAVVAGDWHLVARLSSELARCEQSAVG